MEKSEILNWIALICSAMALIFFILTCINSYTLLKVYNDTTIGLFIDLIIVLRIVIP